MAEGQHALARNKKAFFNYEIEDRIECGIELQGTEVKSIKAGKFSFTDSYARIRNNELFLVGLHVTPYTYASLFNHEPDRDRKLLVHREELKRLKRRLDERGYSLIPLRVYLKRGLVKVELGLGKGKKTIDKRESIKQRDMKREADREMKGSY
jgi:SsrA-binding protein